MKEKIFSTPLKDGAEAKIQVNESNIQESKFNLTDYKDVITNQTIESLKLQNSILEKQKTSELPEGKDANYSKIYEDLHKEGYNVYKEGDIKPIKIDEINNSTGKRIDGIYENEKEILIGEIKSPKECKDIKETVKIDVEEDRKESKWGGELKKYEDELNKNNELIEREKAHLLHIKKTEIIAEQIKKDGFLETKNGKIEIKGKEVKIAYTVPNSEKSVVESALRKMNIKYEVKSTENGTTFIIKK